MLGTAAFCFAAFASFMRAGQAQVVSAVDLARCATIPADANRLACYDQLARSNPTAGRASAAPPPAQPTQSFGMTKPPASKPPEPSRMEARVIGISRDSRDTAVVKLDNDQTWAIDDDPGMLRTGDAIVIKRAALGSFSMSTPTGRVYRARRLR
jgi:hypothetical protein